MEINRDNITDYIRFLYRKRTGQDAPPEVTASWEGLSDEEVQYYLPGLYQSWNITGEQVQGLLLDYYNSKKSHPHPSKAKTKTADTTNNNRTKPLTTGRSRNRWPWMLILVVLVTVMGFVGYKYMQYQALQSVYVTTDNVAVRDQKGEMIGRMDIYPQGEGSYSSLRVFDKKLYAIPVGDKQYPSRKVLLPAAGFMDFLFSKKEQTAFVNKNYLIESKEGIEIYRNVFKEINLVKNENTTLTNPYRETIVGSLSQNSAMKSLYIINTCNNTSADFSSVIKFKAKDGTYVVVAKLSDGKFYQFCGKPDDRSFAEPIALQMKEAFSSTLADLSYTDFIFRKDGGVYFLYDCDKNNLGIYAATDANGLIKYFQSGNDPG